MAGILIYTAAPDSEGTLGGLVELGNATTLGRHLQQELENIRVCASDPLCSEHAPSSDGRGIHGACCHACLLPRKLHANAAIGIWIARSWWIHLQVEVNPSHRYSIGLTPSGSIRLLNCSASFIVVQSRSRAVLELAVQQTTQCS